MTLRRAQIDERVVLWSRAGRGRIISRVMSHTPNCPTCGSDDLITISMSVSGRDLAFTTCHVCETKWWHRDGESHPGSPDEPGWEKRVRADDEREKGPRHQAVQTAEYVLVEIDTVPLQSVIGMVVQKA